MTDDIITKIDKATGCQECGQGLGASPSDDFCSEICQNHWSRKHNGGEVVPPFRAADLMIVFEPITAEIQRIAEAFNNALNGIAREHHWYGAPGQDDHHLAG